MDILAAYREAGSYRGAAAMCGTTHKTVRRVVERHNAVGVAPERKDRGHNYEEVRDLVAERVARSRGRISAKRLLPAARAAGYGGSARNFRRLVAAVKQAWRAGHHRGRRPAVWAPGDTLVIDWGSVGGLHVFCAVLAWSRFRFVRFAAGRTLRAASASGSVSARCLPVILPAAALGIPPACTTRPITGVDVVFTQPWSRSDRCTLGSSPNRRNFA
jgi:hypothetical protein